MKKPVTFKLDPTIADSIKKNADKHKISQSDFIAVLVHCFNMGWDDEKLEEWLELAGKL